MIVVSVYRVLWHRIQMAAVSVLQVRIMVLSPYYGEHVSTTMILYLAGVCPLGKYRFSKLSTVDAISSIKLPLRLPYF